MPLHEEFYLDMFQGSKEQQMSDVASGLLLPEKLNWNFAEMSSFPVFYPDRRLWVFVGGVMGVLGGGEEDQSGRLTGGRITWTKRVKWPVYWLIHIYAHLTRAAGSDCERLWIWYSSGGCLRSPSETDWGFRVDLQLHCLKLEQLSICPWMTSWSKTVVTKPQLSRNDFIEVIHCLMERMETVWTIYLKWILIKSVQHNCYVADSESFVKH